MPIMRDNIGSLNLLMRISFLKVLLLLILLPISLWPQPSQAAGSDLGFVYSNFRFSQTPFIAGQKVRFYAAVRNVGTVDAKGLVSFYFTNELIGEPVEVSTAVGGSYDEVWTDFIVPDHEFNIEVQLRSEGDTDLSNNSYLSPRYTPILDSDNDGVANDKDNCPHNANRSQLDSDHDGIGDVCDSTPLPPEPVIAPPIVVAPVPVPAPIVVAPPAPIAKAKPAPVVNAKSVAPAAVAEAPNEAPAAPIELAVQAAPAITSDFHVSPLARFSYTRAGWNAYQFAAWEPNQEAVYTWQINNGETRPGSNMDYVFKHPGKYTVSLLVAQADGTFVSDEAQIYVSFFHLENPWLSALLGLMVALSVWIVWQGRRQSKLKATQEN